VKLGNGNRRRAGELASPSQQFHVPHCPARATTDSVNRLFVGPRLPCAVSSFPSICVGSRPRIRKQASVECLRAKHSHCAPLPPNPRARIQGVRYLQEAVEGFRNRTLKSVRTPSGSPSRIRIDIGNHLSQQWWIVLLGTVLVVEEPKSKLACPPVLHPNVQMVERQPTNDAGARNPLTRSIAL
jgi:hypothetical protein